MQVQVAFFTCHAVLRTKATPIMADKNATAADTAVDDSTSTSSPWRRSTRKTRRQASYAEARKKLFFVRILLVWGCLQLENEAPQKILQIVDGRYCQRRSWLPRQSWLSTSFPAVSTSVDVSMAAGQDGGGCLDGRQSKQHRPSRCPQPCHCSSCLAIVLTAPQ